MISLTITTSHLVKIKAAIRRKETKLRLAADKPEPETLKEPGRYPETQPGMMQASPRAGPWPLMRGCGRIRTCDPLINGQALCQLCYTSVCACHLDCHVLDSPHSGSPLLSRLLRVPEQFSAAIVILSEVLRRRSDHSGATRPLAGAAGSSCNIRFWRPRLSISYTPV